MYEKVLNEIKQQLCKKVNSIEFYEQGSSSVHIPYSELFIKAENESDELYSCAKRASEKLSQLKYAYGIRKRVTIQVFNSVLFNEEGICFELNDAICEDDHLHWFTDALQLSTTEADLQEFVCENSLLRQTCVVTCIGPASVVADTIRRFKKQGCSCKIFESYIDENEQGNSFHLIIVHYHNAYKALAQSLENITFVLRPLYTELDETTEDEWERTCYEDASCNWDSEYDDDEG